MGWIFPLCALFSLFVHSAVSEMTATTYPEGIVFFVLDITKETTFSCVVTGADGANWVVDDISAREERIRARGILLSDVESLDKATGSYGLNISVPNTVANNETKLICEADSILSEDLQSPPVLFRILQDAITVEKPQGMTVTDSDTTTPTAGNE